MFPVLDLEARGGRHFTARRRTGLVYRLHVGVVDGEKRKHVRLGVMVVRGLLGQVQEVHPRRKVRKNVRVGVAVVRGLLSEVQEVHPRRTPRKDKLPPGVWVGKFEVVVGA